MLGLLGNCRRGVHDTEHALAGDQLYQVGNPPILSASGTHWQDDIPNLGGASMHSLR